MADVWTQFTAFCDTLLRTAEEHMKDEAARASLAQHVTPARNAVPVSGAAAIVAFFEHPPAHRAAVNALDHTQFVQSMTLCEGISLPLRDIMEAFSKLGPVPYGTVWLALLDVAEASGVQGHLAACRDYIRQQMSPPTAGPLVNIPNNAQLESLLSTILGGFPGLQECVNKIVTSQEERPGGGEAALNEVVDKVQEVLLGPILGNIRQANPDAPDVGPAIRNILEGFRGLNAAIASSSSAAQPTPDASMES